MTRQVRRLRSRIRMCDFGASAIICTQRSLLGAMARISVQSGVGVVSERVSVHALPVQIKYSGSARVSKFFHPRAVDPAPGTHR